MAVSDFVQTPASTALLNKKEARRVRIALFWWTGMIAFVLDLCIIAYIMYRQFNPRHNGHSYYYDNYNTMFKWWQLALLALIGVIALIIACYLSDCFDEDYKVVRKGTVVGKYTGTAGAYGSITCYYLTIEGYTRSGEHKQYGMSVSGTYWSTVKEGQVVDFGD